MPHTAPRTPRPAARPRVTVVGGGVVGLLTAHECARAGAQVTLLDAADLPNPHGASYDRHRILRALYPGDPAATGAATAATARWAELSALIADRVPGPAPLLRTGALTVLEPERARAAADTLAAAGAPVRLLDDPRRSHPPLRPERGRAGVLEPDGGILLADRVLHGLTALLREQPGVTLRARARVAGLDPDRGTVRLADGEPVPGDRIVVCAGPWSRALLPPEATRGLRLYRQTQLYCADHAVLDPALAALPAVPALGGPHGAWLVPPAGGTPLKLSAASACRPVDRIDGRAAPAPLREHLTELFRDLLDGFRADWVTGAQDAYYLAEESTHGPRLVELRPGRAWAFAACGGGSFKLAPLIARSLAERALDLPVAPTGLAHLDAGATPSTTTVPHTSGIR
ncbi:FAD-dependent oxidoreductase [Kitasatospora sp. NPDC088134]|uniref:FAD-dependent oxidoreductase n=1 Tax=Kitasatospora sp. NPDC088134 TaxID=3364071 RepID=UPI00382AFFED